jgi:SAM-dependent methyltransferase
MVSLKIQQLALSIVLVAISLLSLPASLYAGPQTVEIHDGQFVFRGTDGVRLDVPYVQTNEHIVEEMLKLLAPRNSDILYDLGCGDGRIVVAAAKQTGARGVGIDIDPGRIVESKANAVAAQVSDRTTFLEQDLFDADIREATAVTLFLLTEINLRLRPKLFRELRPGTRIVSHNFDMGDWKPDKELYLGLWEDGFHFLYYWVLPANVSGAWQGQHDGKTWTLLINQIFQRIEGGLSENGRVSMPLSEATIAGDRIRFSVKEKGQKSIRTYEGKVIGHTMEGVFSQDGTALVPWKATRDPATVSWIE